LGLEKSLKNRGNPEEQRRFDGGILMNTEEIATSA